MIPTRSIVKIAVSRNAMKQKRSFVRTLPSLKKAFEATIEDDLEKKGEEQTEKVKGGGTANIRKGEQGRAERNHRTALHRKEEGV